MGTLRSTRFVRLVRRILDGLLIALVVAFLVALVLGRVVPLFGGTTLVLAGTSMGDSVPMGAAVIATPVDPRDLAVGDVVSLKVGPQQAVFTHRIIRLVQRGEEVWLQTAGDANSEPDLAIVPASAVIGRVDLVFPHVGYLLALLSTAAGLAFVCGVAACLVIVGWLLDSLEAESDHRRPAADGEAAMTAAGGDAPLPVP